MRPFTKECDACRLAEAINRRISKAMMKSLLTGFAIGIGVYLVIFFLMGA